jgi:DNA-3-methyladenine glycosylase II
VLERITQLTQEENKQCGTTLWRAGYIKNIAQQLVNGMLDLKQLAQADDQTFIKDITKLLGIGEWTAQMLLIHVLKRSNIISDKDLAILRGMCIVYHKEAMSKDFFAQKRALYDPYATTVSIYPWVIAGQKTKKK